MDDYPDDFDGDDSEEDIKAIGSCMNCGVDIYDDELGFDEELCDQCSWWLAQADELGGEG